MTSIVCPLCGKHSPLGNFHPEKMDDDIYLVSVRGLGRGRGFAVAETRSAIEDDESEILSSIVNRALEIIALLKRNGVVDADHIVEYLDLF